MSDLPIPQVVNSLDVDDLWEQEVSEVSLSFSASAVFSDVAALGIRGDLQSKLVRAVFCLFICKEDLIFV